jgi:hypothetical protein
MSGEEKLYTLEQARRIIFEEICKTRGEHTLNFEQIVTSDSERSKPMYIAIYMWCNTCGKQFRMSEVDV